MLIIRKCWKYLSLMYSKWLKWRYGMHIGKNCWIARSAHLDKSVNPKGIFIGDNTWVLREAMILAHDHCRRLITETHIGDNCIIGVRSIIIPGVKIGNQCVIGAGSVVTKDVPSNSLVVGNPAKVVKNNIIVSNGKILKS